MSGSREARARALAARSTGSMVRAGLLFGALAVALYAATTLTGEWTLVATARALAGVLELLGESARADGTLVVGPEHRFRIIGECTGVMPAVLVVSAVLACPSSLRAKALGVVLGLALVLAVNQVRLVTLWYLQAVRPEWFERVHLFVWQPLIVGIVLVFWMAWLGRAVPSARGDGARPSA